ncbi:MAG: hypothetical protein KDJ15_00635 [Alphaproteobacteria bacterium]|nr:hypothetical protein [Alphaproteobacteria bacterium]
MGTSLEEIIKLKDQIRSGDSEAHYHLVNIYRASEYEAHADDTTRANLRVAKIKHCEAYISEGKDSGNRVTCLLYLAEDHIENEGGNLGEALTHIQNAIETDPQLNFFGALAFELLEKLIKASLKKKEGADPATEIARAQTCFALWRDVKKTKSPLFSGIVDDLAREIAQTSENGQAVADISKPFPRMVASVHPFSELQKLVESYENLVRVARADPLDAPDLLFLYKYGAEMGIHHPGGEGNGPAIDRYKVLHARSLLHYECPTETALKILTPLIQTGNDDACALLGEHLNDPAVLSCVELLVRLSRAVIHTNPPQAFTNYMGLAKIHRAHDPSKTRGFYQQALLVPGFNFTRAGDLLMLTRSLLPYTPKDQQGWVKSDMAAIVEQANSLGSPKPRFFLDIITQIQPIITDGPRRELFVPTTPRLQ